MTTAATLAHEFYTALGQSDALDPDVGIALHALWQMGRTRWPTVELDAGLWAQHLAESVRRAEGTELSSVLSGVHAEDFYLACACGLGREEAIAAFDKTYLSQLPVLLSHMRLSSSFVDEVRQVLRERLFVGSDGSSPKIAAYAAEGPLLPWVRTVAIRTALNLIDSREHQIARDSSPADRLVARDNPEDELIGKQQRTELFDILRQAFCGLPPLQRRALRLHFAEALTGDEIALRLGVHRATVVRWLSAARQSLLKETERLFRLRLDCTASEVQTLVRETHSQLDVSLSVLLRTVPVDGPSGG